MTRTVALPDLTGVKGRLRISRFGVSSRAGRSGSHTTVLVNGPEYSGMTDNDIRGCLDGTVVWGWNQATQVHVRLGRTDPPGGPKYGESEIFRVLLRWEGIRLPPLTTVSACRLELEVEEAPPVPVRLLLYEVKRDWGPGEGGVHGNNVSPPSPGEAWWCAARHDIDAWGLPGAGFASERDPEADTPVSPLAQTLCQSGADRVSFASSALTDYASERIGLGSPLLFLLKVSDFQEDVPGAFLSLYSAEFGDSRNTARRPRLTLEWQSDAEELVLEHMVELEHGRERRLPSFPVEAGERLIASFQSHPGYEVPLVEVRGGTGSGSESGAGAWEPIGPGLEVGGDWAEVRVRALANPVSLGEAFTADIKDTWVVSKPAEDQIVRWFFTSPTGVEHRVDASYEGSFRWRVRFEPDEPGPWRYRWTHQFFLAPVESPRGRFDVIAGSSDALRERLEALIGEVERAHAVGATDEAFRLRIVFSRLERLAMSLETPEPFRALDGPLLAEALRRTRSALWGKPVPHPVPLEAHAVLRELDGRRLRDPIPDPRPHGIHLGPSSNGPGRPNIRIRRILRRGVRFFRRVAREMRLEP